MKISIAWLLTAALALLVTGCGTIPPPMQKDPGFRPQQMDKVSVLPVIDARVDTAIKLDLDKKVQRLAKNDLEDKRYAVEVVTDPRALGGISGEDLRAGNAGALAKLGPPDARWVMVFTLEELSRRLTFGSSGNAEITMAIVDRQSKRVVWRDKGVGRAGQGGLIGMAMIGMMGEAALEEAVRPILRKIPDRERD